MKRREYLAVSTLVMAGCAAPEASQSGDLQAEVYKEINKIRKKNGTYKLERDPELEVDAKCRSVSMTADDDRVTEIGHDKEVSAKEKAQMIVNAWLEVDDFYKVVLNTTIERCGVGVYQEGDRYKIALNVE